MERHKERADFYSTLPIEFVESPVYCMEIMSKKNQHPEDDKQIAFMDYMHLQHPKAFVCHIANERQTDVRHNKKGEAYTVEGSLLKRKGVVPGMPDIMIMNPFWREYGEKKKDGFRAIEFIGLAIELKHGKNKLTDAQKECLERLSKCGWKTRVHWELDKAIEEADEYMKGVVFR